MKPVIELKNVSKVYQLGDVKVEALREIDLEIKEREFVSIMGASGSGKSTLLNLIGVLDRPTSGKVYLDGVDISKLNDSQLARLRGQKIGFVFQFFNLYPTLTALANVELPLMILEQNKKERVEKARKFLREVGLEHRSDHMPAQLSGGERQRVSIARAIATDPSIILADEPTGNLDSKSGNEIIEIFRKMNKDGKTVIVVTHEKFIAKQSKRIIKIKDGKIGG